jgi:hypothetical protein
MSVLSLVVDMTATSLPPSRHFSTGRMIMYVRVALRCGAETVVVVVVVDIVRTR